MPVPTRATLNFLSLPKANELTGKAVLAASILIEVINLRLDSFISIPLFYFYLCFIMEQDYHGQL